MTDGEIRTSYLDAAHQKQQLEILAQLNGCSVNTIIRKLRKMGIKTVEPVKKKSREAYARWTEDDVIQLLNLRHSGKSINAIALEMNRTETAVKSVLCRLDPNNKTEPTKTMLKGFKIWRKQQLNASR